MKTKGTFSGKWNDGQNDIIVNLPMISFEEDGSQILYCPALDLSGYGKSEKEALESFQIVLGEFLLYTTHKRTLDKELISLGWLVKKKRRKMIPPSMQKLLVDNDNFSRIFNNFPFRKFDQPVTIPAA